MKVKALGVTPSQQYLYQIAGKHWVTPHEITGDLTPEAFNALVRHHMIKEHR